MANEKVLISVRSLCKDFVRPNGSRITALEGINLDVFDGEILAIVGLSGSGKSTLLRCMAGLLKPDRGQVIYSAAFAKRKNFVSFVFQNFSLFPWLNVRDNVGLSIQDLSKDEREKRIDQILETVGLSEFDDSYPRELSGGMRQRVSIARAMVCDPLVMFMDEPFSSLDPLTGESLRSEMGRLWMQQARRIHSVVLVTHSLEEALQLADRIVILSTSPGTIFKTLAVPLSRPRLSNSPEYLALEEQLETAFGELHLDKLTAAHYDAPETNQSVTQSFVEDQRSLVSGSQRSDSETQIDLPPLPPRYKPLVNISLSLVEGLLARLSEEEQQGESMDLYDLASDMKLRLDQMLPAVAAAEMLGYIDTPGTTLVLTESGQDFVAEQDNQLRAVKLRESVLRLPVVSFFYHFVKENEGEEGVEREEVITQLGVLLPFEDPEEQFEALLKWCRMVNLLSFDGQTGRIEAVDWAPVAPQIAEPQTSTSD